MKGPKYFRRRQRSEVFLALLLFNLILVLLQLWLFVSVLEGLLGGHSTMAIPAAGASILILAVNVWILRGTYTGEEE